MHYRNGREAKNGDKVVQLNGGLITHVGVLRDAVAGNDYCNGRLEPIDGQIPGSFLPIACLCDCLHADDLAAILADEGLDRRPAGK